MLLKNLIKDISKDKQNIIVSGVDNTISDGHQPYAINLTAENEHSELGDTWTPQTAANSTKDLLGVAYGNNKYVAVGKDGKIFVSQDASQGSWSAAPVNPENGGNRLRSVTFGNELFVAVGNNGTILRSEDGETWIKQQGNTGVNYDLNKVEFLNGNFLVVGQTKVLTSTTGKNGSWTTYDTQSNATLHGITYFDGTYVVVGDGGSILTSDNLNIWTRRDVYSTTGNIVNTDILDIS